MMRFSPLLILFTALTSPLLTTTGFAQSNGGLMTPWDFKRTIENLTQYSRRLYPLLDEVKPGEWRDAPQGYALQQKLVKTQLESIAILTQNLARDPERLPVVLDLFFRYENFELTLASLLEGVRKYQNPAVADLIAALRNENSPARQSLKDYMVDLATTKDQELRIADQEAQRCRGLLLKPSRRK